MSVNNFSQLPISFLAQSLTQQSNLTAISTDRLEFNSDDSDLVHQLNSLKQQWQNIQQDKHQLAANDDMDTLEQREVDWLIQLFNSLFSTQNVTLVRGQSEPEYFPATDTQPARIEFAHGFFQSALHEISHWSIAGKHRRTLSDFGYWYAPDGRTEAQQKAFEQVEIKPQAIECLFSLICGREFRVSQDNLHADFDTSQSTFAKDVLNQAEQYINSPQNLPTDAKSLLTVLAIVCHDKED